MAGVSGDLLESAYGLPQKRPPHSRRDGMCAVPAHSQGDRWVCCLHRRFVPAHRRRPVRAGGRARGRVCRPDLTHSRETSRVLGVLLDLLPVSWVLRCGPAGGGADCGRPCAVLGAPGLRSVALAAATSGPGSLLSTFRLSSWCLPVWLAPGWRPGDSVQLEWGLLSGSSVTRFSD